MSALCIGVVGEGCFRPAVESGRCVACARTWFRHGKPKAQDVDALFAEVTDSLARYLDTPITKRDDEVTRRRAILDEKMKLYVEHRFGFVGRKRERIETLPVSRLIEIAQSLPSKERRDVARACLRLPPEVLRARKQASGRQGGLVSVRNGRLAALAEKGAIARWGRGRVTDAERDRIVELRGLGWQHGEIAAAVKVSLDTVKRILRERGLTKARKTA